ncbi:hypothetical protein Hanom_Chr04g00296741 [Helianthus anomalus]
MRWAWVNVIEFVKGISNFIFFMLVDFIYFLFVNLYKLVLRPPRCGGGRKIIQSSTNVTPLP